jgi:hypothetical protein
MRDLISRHLFSPLQGMTPETWRSLLEQNRCAIDPPYWPRAAFQTAVTALNRRFAHREERAFGARVESVLVHPPVFILGHWRHGTTHLHNLLALDPQLTFPTLYQTLYPATFLTTERVIPRLGGFFLLRKRPHDNVALNFGVPNEDELALCVHSGLSPYLAWAFPREAAFYDRFLTFHAASDDERARWRSSFVHFLKKLTLKHDRPIVLKSPPHTARIGLLLDLFPGARFVHIRRDPVTVFLSTNHMYSKTMCYWQLQRSPAAGFEDRIIAGYRTMYDAFFAERPLIPAGQFCEVTYEELLRAPVAQVEAIYDALGLPGFAAVRPCLEDYLGSAPIVRYERNTHPALPDPVRQRIGREWRRSFEEWGYAC